MSTDVKINFMVRNGSDVTLEAPEECVSRVTPRPECGSRGSITLSLPLRNHISRIILFWSQSLTVSLAKAAQGQVSEVTLLS